MTTLLAHLIAIEEGFYVAGSIPQRNNNPGDLRHAPDETHPEDAPNSVGAFETPEKGWAMLERQLELFAGRGLTVAQAIAAYAPPDENNTTEYLANVCAGLEITVDQAQTFTMTDALTREI